MIVIQDTTPETGNVDDGDNIAHGVVMQSSDGLSAYPKPFKFSSHKS